MKQIYELKTKLLEELGEQGKKDLNDTTLERIYRMASAAKNLCKIIHMDEEEQGGMSRAAYSRNVYGVEPGRDMSYRSYEGGMSNRSYDDGASYRRGRDSMGRFTSRDDGLMHKLEQLADEAQDEQTRREIEKLVQKMR